MHTRLTTEHWHPLRRYERVDRPQKWHMVQLGGGGVQAISTDVRSSGRMIDEQNFISILSSSILYFYYYHHFIISLSLSLLLLYPVSGQDVMSLAWEALECNSRPRQLRCEMGIRGVGERFCLKRKKLAPAPSAPSCQ